MTDGASSRLFMDRFLVLLVGLRVRSNWPVGCSTTRPATFVSAFQDGLEDFHPDPQLLAGRQELGGGDPPFPVGQLVDPVPEGQGGQVFADGRGRHLGAPRLGVGFVLRLDNLILSQYEQKSNMSLDYYF